MDPNTPTDGLFIGDANDDGLVTGAGLISVQQNFGNTLAPVGAVVPEPASVCLLTLAGLGCDGTLASGCCIAVICHQVQHHRH